MSSLACLVFSLHLLSTFAMFGLIWFVQVVHYPLFLRVGTESFAAYETAHANRTTYVVAPLMLLELATALALLAHAYRPTFVSTPSAWCGAALVGVVWLSTAFVQVPLHNRLHAGYSADVIRQLVATNWLRTAAWTARTALLLRWASLAVSGR